MMYSFDYWKNRYDKGWATKNQLQRLVNIGALTKDEFNQIVE